MTGEDARLKDVFSGAFFIHCMHCQSLTLYTDLLRSKSEEKAVQPMRLRLAEKIDGDALESTLQFLERCLRFDPSERAPAAGLLDDSWLLHK